MLSRDFSLIVFASRVSSIKHPSGDNLFMMFIPCKSCAALVTLFLKAAATFTAPSPLFHTFFACFVRSCLGLLRNILIFRHFQQNNFLNFVYKYYCQSYRSVIYYY